MFLLLFLLVPTFGWAGKSFSSSFAQLVLQKFVTKTGSLSVDTASDYCVSVLKFCVCKHGVLCASEINSNGGFKTGHVDLSLQPLKASYLQYPNVSGHQTLQGGNLPWGALAYKITWAFNYVVCEITWQIKIFIILLPK